MDRLRRLLTVSGLLLALVVATAGQTSSAPGSHDSKVAKDLARVRQVTARFHDVAEAEAAGYISTHECVALPTGEAMGIHFIKPNIIDGTADLENPEILLYIPYAGGLKLIGVEYFQPDADQDLDTDEDRPFLFDRGYDGPMEGHSPGQPRHYDLHVWVWHGNPDGMFAQFNPTLSCPAA